MKIIGRIILWAFAVLGGLTALFVAGLIVGAASLAPEARAPDRVNLWIDLNAGVADGASTSPFDGLLFADRALVGDMVLAIDRAAGDDKVKGLMVELGATPLSLAHAQELRAAVRRFRGSGKPAHVFAEDMGGFGGGTGAYALAAGFDKVWLQPSGGVGLTGFSLEMPFLSQLFEAIGADPEFSRRHEYKSAAEMFSRRDLSPEARSNLSAMLASWGEQAALGIGQSRGLTTGAIDALFDRGPFLADEALDIGLVDELAYWDQARDGFEEIAGAEDFVTVAEYLQTGTFAHLPFDNERSIALIHATGQVMRGDGRPGAVMGSNTVIRALDDAAKDDTVAAIVLRVDSPGGDYVAADAIWHAVKQARKDKPVVASVGAMAASGGYYVAMGADKVVAHPGSVVGSIGVFAGKFVLADMWDKLGVGWSRVATNDRAAMMSMNRPFTEAERAKFEKILDAIYADFSTKAAEARGMTAAEIDTVARGRVFSGLDAERNGLVDALGGLSEARVLANELAGQPSDQVLPLRPYPKREPFDVLRQWFGGGGPLRLSEVVGLTVQALGFKDKVEAGMTGRTTLLAPGMN